MPIKSKCMKDYGINIWIDSIGISLVFCRDLSPKMRHRSTMTQQNQTTVKTVDGSWWFSTLKSDQLRLAQSHQLERSWPVCFQMWKESHQLITLKKAEQLQATITPFLTSKMQKFTKEAWLEEKIHPSKTHSSCQKRYLDNQKTAELDVKLAQPSLLFSRLGTLRQLSVPKLVKNVYGKCFASNEEVKRGIDEYFHNLKYISGKEYWSWRIPEPSVLM